MSILSVLTMIINRPLEMRLQRQSLKSAHYQIIKGKNMPANAAKAYGGMEV
jgi:hypothetical protein